MKLQIHPFIRRQLREFCLAPALGVSRVNRVPQRPFKPGQVGQNRKRTERFELPQVMRKIVTKPANRRMCRRRRRHHVQTQLRKHHVAQHQMQHGIVGAQSLNQAQSISVLVNREFVRVSFFIKYRIVTARGLQMWVGVKNA